MIWPKKSVLFALFFTTLLGILGCTSNSRLDNNKQVPSKENLTAANTDIQVNYLNLKPFKKNSDGVKVEGFKVSLLLKDLRGRSISSNYSFVGPIYATDNLGNTYISTAKATYDTDENGKLLPNSSVLVNEYFKPALRPSAKLLNLDYQMKPKFQLGETIIKDIPNTQQLPDILKFESVVYQTETNNLVVFLVLDKKEADNKIISLTSYIEHMNGTKNQVLGIGQSPEDQKIKYQLTFENKDPENRPFDLVIKWEYPDRIWSLPLTILTK